MKYIRYEKGGKDVSAIGLGCMRLAAKTPDQCLELIHTALDAGINFFDHADIYGNGKCEEIFGAALKKEPGLRDQLFIQSKCGIRDGFYDFSKEYILKSVDGILKRLGTDHIDALLLHRPDVLMEPEEVSAAFDELAESGKVIHFGVCNENPFQMELLKTSVKQKIAVDQIQLSCVHTPVIDAGINVNTNFNGAYMKDGGILEYCRIKDIIVQAWSPLQKGFFQGIFLGDPEYQKLNQKLAELADQYHAKPDAIAYAWLLRIPAKMQVIAGTTNPERISSLSKAAEIPLTREEWYEIYRAAGNQLP